MQQAACLHDFSSVIYVPQILHNFSATIGLVIAAREPKPRCGTLLSSVGSARETLWDGLISGLQQKLSDLQLGTFCCLPLHT